MMAATSDGLAAELERLRPDSEDSALVAGRKMYCRAAFVDKHFDTIRAALSASTAEVEALRGALERVVAEDAPEGTGGGTGGGIRMARIARAALSASAPEGAR
jgi:hypothetical protein